MPYVVELDLAASDFRQHYRPEPDVQGKPGAEPHWLLSAVYGRDLLKAKLRKVRPDLLVPSWRHAADLDPLLDEMVDLLGLRCWNAPVGVAAKVCYLRLVLAMLVAVENDRPVPPFS
jgi:hypothetical protein